MASTNSLLIFTLFLFEYISCDFRRVPDGQDNGLGLTGRVIFHKYKFKESHDLASQLISGMMNFNVELGSLIHGFVYRVTTPKRESRKEHCFRQIFELPWYKKMKPTLTAHLEGVLSNLIDKEAELTKVCVTCSSSDKECNERCKKQALEKIDYFGKTELHGEMQIKNMYLTNIPFEMERCLNNEKSGVNKYTGLLD